MEEKYGIPVLQHLRVQEIGAALGIKPRKRIEDPIPFADYVQRELSKEERGDLRFAPKIQVVRHQYPAGHTQEGKIFTGFRLEDKNWATVFALLPGDLVLVTVEWKHGADEIIIVPPSGVPSKDDYEVAHKTGRHVMEVCARREFLEETGFILSELTSLSGLPGRDVGLPASGRRSTQRGFPYLGKVDLGVPRGPSKLDESEDLKLALVPLGIWIALVLTESVEMCVGDITFRALHRLGRLTVT